MKGLALLTDIICYVDVISECQPTLRVAFWDCPEMWALNFFESFLPIFSPMSVLKQLSEEFESVDAF